jgi:glycosyltransferase involved in cell wall biosynthesis
MMTTDTQSINAAAALVCPTWTQPPVRALLNAAAAGVPIITTPSPIVSAIFSPQQVILVPQGDSRALARALRELATDPAAAAPRARQAQAQVLSHHSAASALSKWQAALESMVAQPELK